MSAEHVVPLDAEHGAEAEAPPEARARALGRYHKWAVLALVAVGTFMTALDASIVNIGLPSIARAFRAPVGGAVEWVIIVYLVVIAGTLLTFGRLSDLVGRKPVWMTGLALFVLGSALCGAATSLRMLIVARAMQGLGGALIFAPGLAIIADAFPPAERGRALGVNAVVFAIGTSFGPIHASRLSGNEHLDTFLAEDSRDRLGDVGILATGQPRPLLDDGDAASEAPVRLRQLEANISGAEHDQVGRHAVELEHLDMREWRGGSQVRDRRDRGTSSYVEEHTVSRQHSRSTVVRTHFQRLRRHTKRPVPMTSSAPLAL